MPTDVCDRDRQKRTSSGFRGDDQFAYMLLSVRVSASECKYGNMENV